MKNILIIDTTTRKYGHATLFHKYISKEVRIDYVEVRMLDSYDVPAFSSLSAFYIRYELVEP